MHFVATFVVPYIHTIKVGIQANSAEEAEEVANHEFCVGDIAREDGPCTVVSDTYEEDEGAGMVVRAGVEQVTAPALPDRSVLLMQADAAARRCVEVLTQAYANGAENGGSVEWDEVDEAHRHAVEAMRLLAA